MSHQISGLVAAPELLAAFARTHDLAPPAPLDLGYAFLAIDKDEMERIAGTAWDLELIDDEYAAIQTGFIETVRALSETGAVAYLHTEYFGGEGGQAAMTACDGEIVFGPEHGRIGAIDTALGRLGVPRGGEGDLFEQVGLGRHRDNDGWREAAATARA